MVQQGHPVGDVEGPHDVVSDHDGGHAGLLRDLHDQLVHGGRVHGIEAGHRLVVEHDLGPAHDGPRQAHPLLHAPRQLRGELGQHVGRIQVHVLQRLAHPPQDLLLGQALELVVAQALADVFVDVHGVEERGVLEDVADLPADALERRPRGVHHRLAVDEHVAPVGHDQA